MSITALRSIKFSADKVTLEGDLLIPERAQGIILFAHGSGSGRFSPRNRYVAGVLNKAGLATFLIDLLSKKEEAEDALTGFLRFNIPFLAKRLLSATDWLLNEPDTRKLKIGYFGASTGAAAALVASVERLDKIFAIVSRGGRPDLAKEALPLVKAPTLLIVGGNDFTVIALNQEALALMRCAHKALKIVPGATHLFEEEGALEKVAELARDWFLRYLGGDKLER